MAEDRFAELLAEKYVWYHGYTALAIAARCGVHRCVDYDKPIWTLQAFAKAKQGQIPATISMSDCPPILRDHIIFHEMGHIFLLRAGVHHQANAGFSGTIDVARYRWCEHAIERFAIAMHAATMGLFIHKASLPVAFSRGEFCSEIPSRDIVELIPEVVPHFDFTPKGIFAMRKLVRLVRAEQWAKNKSSNAKS